METTSKFYDIRASADRVVLYIYGDIVRDESWKWSIDDCCPSDIIKALADHPDAAVDLHINSGGGDAFAGFAIANIIRTHSGRKTGYVDGLAASAASFFVPACDEVVIPKTAYVMIHKSWTSAWGCNADELRKAAEMLDTVDRGMLTLYMSKAKEGITEEAMTAKIAAETWLPGEDAAAIWNHVTLVDLEAAACTSNMFGLYSNAPAVLRPGNVMGTSPHSEAKPPAEPLTPTPPAAPEHQAASDMETDLDLMRSFIFTQKQKGDQ